MPDRGAFLVFALASLALAIVPGPAVLYIVAQSVQGGRRAGVVSALGVSTGGMVHVAAAVIGLSAVLAASATAFTIVKIAGAVYLVWLGIRTLLSRDDSIAGRRAEPTMARTYRQGVIVNVLNPKTALFFLAFLPQFVDPDGSTRGQLALCDRDSGCLLGSAPPAGRGCERQIPLLRDPAREEVVNRRRRRRSGARA
jgi:threonine/homoserine/homoserine lactone efflux protein